MEQKEEKGGGERGGKRDQAKEAVAKKENCGGIAGGEIEEALKQESSSEKRRAKRKEGLMGGGRGEAEGLTSRRSALIHPQLRPCARPHDYATPTQSGALISPRRGRRTPHAPPQMTNPDHQQHLHEGSHRTQSFSNCNLRGPRQGGYPQNLRARLYAPWRPATLWRKYDGLRTRWGRAQQLIEFFLDHGCSAQKNTRLVRPGDIGREGD